MPASSSSARIAAVAARPKTARGAGSGVMSVICGRCCAFHAWCAVMSASSYAGSGQPGPGGTTNATRRA